MFPADTAPDATTNVWSQDSASESDKPVFGANEPGQTKTEPEVPPEHEPSFDADPGISPDSKPSFLAEPEPFPSLDAKIGQGTDEPVFALDGEPTDLPETEPSQEPHETLGGSFSTDAPAFEMVSGGVVEDESVAGKFEDQSFAPPQLPAEEAEWSNIVPDAETTTETLPEKEYALFDETPAAEVAEGLPPRRRLGRTGPVWVIGGFVLVLIAGLVWLAVSRLAGEQDSSSQADAEPTVQRAEAATPTAAAPTATVGPPPTAVPVMLPIGANVIVGDTDGQGVNLREEPGRFGTFVTVLAEGTVLVVLPAEPEDEQYPAEADGHLWYRMRVIAEEGEEPFQGWSASDFFAVVEQ